MMKHKSGLGSESGGFSVVEIMTVMAIILVMTGMLVPSLSGFQGTYQRKQAAGILMDTLEQARLQAVRSGGRVTVVFAKAADSANGADAMIISGEPPLGAAQPNRVTYSRWIKLPEGICFLSAENTLGTSPAPEAAVISSLPTLKGAYNYASVVFNPTGQVQFPTDRPLKMAIFEGMRQGGKETATGVSAKDKLSRDGTYEIVSLTRFTGRPQFDVGTLE